MTTISDIAKKATNRRKGFIQFLNKSHLEVNIFFDCESYDYCTALLITPYAGLIVLPIDGSCADEEIVVPLDAIDIHVPIVGHCDQL